jgi:hypothetical protein
MLPLDSVASRAALRSVTRSRFGRVMCYAFLNQRETANMQSKFIQCETLEQALDACPWACEIIEVDGGFRCFESVDDAKVWRAQK